MDANGDGPVCLVNLWGSRSSNRVLSANVMVMTHFIRIYPQLKLRLLLTFHHFYGKQIVSTENCQFSRHVFVGIPLKENSSSSASDIFILGHGHRSLCFWDYNNIFLNSTFTFCYF